GRSSGVARRRRVGRTHPAEHAGTTGRAGLIASSAHHAAPSSTLPTIRTPIDECRPSDSVAFTPGQPPCAPTRGTGWGARPLTGQTPTGGRTTAVRGHR